jgi:hypothetical protein
VNGLALREIQVGGSALLRVLNEPASTAVSTMSSIAHACCLSADRNQRNGSHHYVLKLRAFLDDW